jgi:hypothetical protein
MENKTIDSWTDLELAELQGQSYNELMRIQANLQAIQTEINKRKPVPEPIKETKNEQQDTTKNNR